MEERLCSGPFAHFLRKKALDLELVLQYLSDRARGKGTITSKGLPKALKWSTKKAFSQIVHCKSFLSNRVFH